MMGQVDREFGDVGVLLFQAEDGIRDVVRSRGLGDVYKRQILTFIFYKPICYKKNL